MPFCLLVITFKDIKESSTTRYLFYYFNCYCWNIPIKIEAARGRKKSKSSISFMIDRCWRQILLKKPFKHAFKSDQIENSRVGWFNVHKVWKFMVYGAHLIIIIIIELHAKNFENLCMPWGACCGVVFRYNGY